MQSISLIFLTVNSSVSEQFYGCYDLILKYNKYWKLHVALNTECAALSVFQNEKFLTMTAGFQSQILRQIRSQFIFNEDSAESRTIRKFCSANISRTK